MISKLEWGPGGCTAPSHDHEADGVMDNGLLCRFRPNNFLSVTENRVSSALPSVLQFLCLFFCSKIASEWPLCFDSLMDITRHKQSITELGDNCGDLPHGPRQGSIDLGSLEYRDTETRRHRHRITN